MAFEFQERLARLADVKDADTVAVLGESGEEVGVVRGGGQAKERRGVRHCLLGCGGGEVAGAVGCYESIDISFCSWAYGCYGNIRGERKLTFINFLTRLIDDCTMFEASKVKHPDTAVRAARDKDVDAVGAEADIEDFFVVGDELSFGGEGRDVPYCTGGVDARGNDEAGRKGIPVQGGKRCSVFRGLGIREQG